MGVPNPEASQGIRSEIGKRHTSSAGALRFGSFELRPDTHELLKSGIRIHLQSKPFQVLETLLSRPGELITRDELQRKLWPSGTFVDFESGLNTAINRLRVALSDSADEPRFIETLPRMGYRFICAVEHELPPEPGDTIPKSPLPVPPAPTLASAPVSPVVSAPAVTSSRRILWWVAGGALAVGGLLLGMLQFSPKLPSAIDFQPVTYRGGAILSARFLAPSRVIYSLSKDRRRQVFVSDVRGTDSRPLAGIDAVSVAPYDTDLAALSFVAETSPESPLLRLSRVDWQGHPRGVLAEGITAADWTSDGRHLVVIRSADAESRLESPPGHVLYRSQGWLNCVRLSPNGANIAFLEHPTRDDDAGTVRVVENSGSARSLTAEWASADGLAWDAAGQEIWFTASEGGLTRSLYAVTAGGHMRKLSQQPLSLRLLDVSRDGRALLSVDDLRMIVRTAVKGKESEISPFDFSHVEDMSRDGHLLLFTESGDAGGPHYGAYVYDFCSKSARRFGSGRALALSPDHTRALTIDPRDRNLLTLTSLSSGNTLKFASPGFLYQWAKFLNNSELLVGGSFAGRPLLIARQQVASGKLIPLTDVPYLDSVAISSDGKRLAGRMGHSVEIVDLTPQGNRSVDIKLTDDPLVWSADGRSLFLLSAGPAGYSILNYEIATARTSVWKMIDMQHSLSELGGLVLAPEAGAYAWSAHIELSRLYLVGNAGRGS